LIEHGKRGHEIWERWQRKSSTETRNFETGVHAKSKKETESPKGVEKRCKIAESSDGRRGGSISSRGRSKKRRDHRIFKQQPAGQKRLHTLESGARERELKKLGVDKQEKN